MTLEVDGRGRVARLSEILKLFSIVTILVISKQTLDNQLSDMLQ